MKMLQLRTLTMRIFLMLLFIPKVIANGTDYLDDCLKADSFLSLEKFESATDRFPSGFCLGVIQGVIDTLTIITSRDCQGSVLACLPSTVTRLQTVKVVIKYLQEHPQYLHERETGLVLSAITSAFPCKITN